MKILAEINEHACIKSAVSSLWSIQLICNLKDGYQESAELKKKKNSLKIIMIFVTP